MQPICDSSLESWLVEEGKENVDVAEVVFYELVDEVWGWVCVCSRGRIRVRGIPLEVVERC